MADRPIAFSAPMVLALLAGRKTQTRRLMPQQEALRSMYSPILSGTTIFNYAGEEEICRAPFMVGDRLYVRESYFQFGHWEPVEGKQTKGRRQKWAFVGTPGMVEFDPPADYLLAKSPEFPGLGRWYRRLGRFMPRNLSRMWLAVTDVRVQRLQECSEEDAIAEGIKPGLHPDTGVESGWRDYSLIEAGPHKGKKHPHAIVPWREATKSYETLWNSLHTTEGERWEDDPWVVAVSFVVNQGNLDER